MKLRTQFLVLVGGIIAVPFLVSTFMLFEQFYAARGYVATAVLPRWRHERDFVLMERDIVITTGGPWAERRSSEGGPDQSAEGGVRFK